MSRKRTPRMSFEDAMDLADSMDLPDGAFWAMAHELADLDYGDGFPPRREQASPYTPTKKERERIERFGTLTQCDPFHWQIRAGKTVLVDWWPHKHKFRVAGDSKATTAGFDRASHIKSLLNTLAVRSENA